MTTPSHVIHVDHAAPDDAPLGGYTAARWATLHAALVAWAVEQQAAHGGSLTVTGTRWGGRCGSLTRADAWLRITAGSRRTGRRMTPLRRATCSAGITAPMAAGDRAMAGSSARTRTGASNPIRAARGARAGQRPGNEGGHSTLPDLGKIKLSAGQAARTRSMPLTRAKSDSVQVRACAGFRGGHCKG